jgi:hypothetical protein
MTSVDIAATSIIIFSVLGAYIFGDVLPNRWKIKYWGCLCDPHLITYNTNTKTTHCPNCGNINHYEPM